MADLKGHSRDAKPVLLREFVEMPEEKKPTLKDLLKRHDISYAEFYEFCQVPTEDISVIYKHNRCTKTGIEKMLAFINTWAKTSYTVEDIFIEKMC